MPRNERPHGRPRKKEYLYYKYCKMYNQKIIYRLRVSRQTLKVDRFNSKEQENWVVEHDEQTRIGILLQVGEAVPTGQYSFKTLVEKGQKSNIYKYCSRRMIAKIKDNDTGVEFYINLMNVELDDDILEFIYADFWIPDGWIKNRTGIMNNIGKTFERQQLERKSKGGQRKKEIDNTLNWCEKQIGKSKSKYDREETLLKVEVSQLKRRLIDKTLKLEALREYWAGIPKEERKI